jgi:hypothetical protein
MALIPCPECGRQISTLASSCPGCGCPVAAVATATPPVTAAPAPPVPPQPATPTKKLWVKVRPGRLDPNNDHKTGKSVKRGLTEITFDGGPVSINEAQSAGEPASKWFGPIPYILG